MAPRITVPVALLVLSTEVDPDLKRQGRELDAELENLTTGVCLQTPLDYRALMDCPPGLPAPRRLP